MTIKSIIGPAVIAAMISGIISYLSLRRKGNLQYITQERKEWREKMREIASALDGATYKKTLKILTKLKVRINAYGDENNYRYDEDGHIWKVIRKLEEKNPGKEVLREQQRMLIDYISLLLKFDWERSKKEVRGDLYKAIGVFFEVLAGCSFFAIIIICGEESKIEIWNWFMIATSYMVCIFVTKRILLYGCKGFYMQWLYLTKKTKKYTVGRKIMAVFFLIIEIGILMVVYVIMTTMFVKQMEVILLDDCLGQHYFRMKEVKPGELLSLIKYIAMNKQKMLIMNSRVTIFQEAKEQSVELKQFAEDERFRIKILDMNRLSVVDKGRILRNHLFAKEVPEEYYRDICRERNYSKIVQHKNYTPRIMEYVTRKANYKDVRPEKYYLFITDCLNNPREIWRDEFMNRIRPEDRIFLTTLYSLTDTTIELSRLQSAFYERIKNEIQIDTSRDVWESVLRRLEGAFIILIDRNGQREIGVLNPSVNDFLKEYLEENVPERENIRRCAIDAGQIERGFSDEIKDLLETGRILEFYFENDEDRYNIVVNGICDYGVLHERYKNLIRDFMNDLAEKVLFYVYGKCRMFVMLLSERFDQVYETRKNLDKSKMEKVLGRIALEDFKTFIWTVERRNVGFLYDEYGEEIAEALSAAVTGYAVNVPAIDYLGYSDIQEAAELNLVEYDGDIGVDEQAVEEMLKDELTHRVREDMFDMTADLPDPWGKRIREEIEEVDIYIDGVGTCIGDFWKDRARAYTGESQQEDSAAEKILDEIFR